MNRFGGFGGGNNMQALMRQAQKMQEDAIRAQNEINETEVQGTSGGGMVTVTMFGNKSIKEIKLNPQVVDGDDVELLEDLIVAAIKDAEKKADELKESKLGGLGALGGMM